ncbi:hypothetical protein DRO29_05775 [Candidatus Bathyarchaeota archaeon]|nr:MAG: hypothetical protein CW680_01100 [Candidatus Bathyarchaeota archaeon]RLG95393.1 MAG: hypothetical protein DRO29_05775 [Candidatus Bathyarchaeota archaeon]
MGYCTVTDVRVLTGVSESMLSDSEIESLIAFSDAQIDDDLGGLFQEPVPERVRYLSALLTAIKVYSRPDFRGGFSVGGFSVSGQHVEECLERWMGEVRRIYAYYGKVVREAPSGLRRV